MTGDQDDLSVRLTRSSSEFAISALSAMSDGKPSVALLHAATALEHLAKAVLAARHPSLIAVASRDNFDSLLMLVGEGHRAKPLSRIRTIGAREALDRATRFAPDCAELIDDVALLILVRDGPFAWSVLAGMSLLPGASPVSHFPQNATCQESRPWRASDRSKAIATRDNAFAQIAP